jgi:hypothetical protein
VKLLHFLVDLFELMRQLSIYAACHARRAKISITGVCHADHIRHINGQRV